MGPTALQTVNHRPPPPTRPPSEPWAGHVRQSGSGCDTVWFAEMVSALCGIYFMANWILSARVSCHIVAKLTLSL